MRMLVRTIFMHTWNLFDEQLRLNGNISSGFLGIFRPKQHSKKQHENIQQKQHINIHNCQQTKSERKPSLCLKTAIIIHFQCKRNEQSCGSQKRYPHYHFARRAIERSYFTYAIRGISVGGTCKYHIKD